MILDDDKLNEVLHELTSLNTSLKLIETKSTSFVGFLNIIFIIYFF